jgi:hypothetical protein
VTEPVRGDALVDAVIAALEANSGGLLPGMPAHQAEGLAPDAIAALSLPNGKPLPASLAKFLAYDAGYLDVLDEAGQLEFKTFRAMMTAEFDAETAEVADFSELLPGSCLVLPGGSDSRRFMYVGEPDVFGEYPVFVVDIDDVPYVCLAYPGLDVYLADGVTEDLTPDTYTDVFDHEGYAPMIEDQARRNFGGYVSFDPSGDAETEHLDDD